MRSKSKSFDSLKALVSHHLDVDESSLKFDTYNIEHHIAHTASAYFASPWERSAGITVDGSGDFVSCMLSDCAGDEIKPLKRVFVPHSLGTMYTAVCQFIGYPKYGDEGKVMGLAPLGTDRYSDFFEAMLTPTENGFTLNPSYFLPFGANQGMEINDDGEMILTGLRGPDRAPL
jgi:carbamoyltransferase